MHINDQLESIGWLFCQVDDNEWRWLKFNSLGSQIAQYGDQIWKADCAMLGINGGEIQ